jgi:hypothetical protein
MKKVRAYLEIDEASTCSKCKFSHLCKLKDKVPTAKVTSTKDVLVMVYMMVKQANLLENQSQGETAQRREDEEDESYENHEKMNRNNLSEDEKLLKEEADRQMKAFLEETNERPKPSVNDLNKEEELALYIAGIRLLNGLPLIIPQTLEHKQEILDLLETNIQEYTTRKKLDTIVRLQRELDRTSSKQKIKRKEALSIHDLVEISNRKMDVFSKSAVNDKGSA